MGSANQSLVFQTLPPRITIVSGAVELFLIPFRINGVVLSAKLN
jgi:hypothetical protein